MLAAILCCAAQATVPARAEETTIPATQKTPAIPAYVAHPLTARSPGVLVLHGCGGFSRRYAQIADWLASHGYVGVAIDTLAPQGLRDACSDPRGSRSAAEYARVALDWMRAQPYVDGERLALLGYSMGAIAILDLVDPRHETDAPPGVRAAVTYYPSCRNRDPAKLSVPLRIFDGDADDWTPAPPCRALAQAAAAAGKALLITTYPAATHAFDVDRRPRVEFGHHLSYDSAAAADAATQTLLFLQRYLA